MGGVASIYWHPPISFKSPGRMLWTVRLMIGSLKHFCHVNVGLNFSFPFLPSSLPNGSINLCAFNELAVIVSAFTNHISNVPISASSHIDELNYLVNHILTCPLRDENGKWDFWLHVLDIDMLKLTFDAEFFTAFEKQAHKIESYYDIPWPRPIKFLDNHRKISNLLIDWTE